MTVEEKAERYIKNGWGELNVGGWKARMKESFVAGHTEAMRWRDPKEELPENVGLYLCKCEKKLGFYFDIVFFNKVWRSDKVIGWRPIE